METKEKLEPMDWRDVAVVAFKDNVPVILSSAEPSVMLWTLLDLLERGQGEEVDPSEVSKALHDLEWKLYATEDAKALFAREYCDTHPPESGPPGGATNEE